MKVVQLALVSSALMVFMGCLNASRVAQPTYDTLDWAQTDYTQSMRWDNKVTLLGYIAKEDRPVMEEMLERFNVYHISDYEIGIIEINPDGVSANVIVIYRGYSNKKLIEIELIEDQEWYWSVEKGKWFLSPSPDSLTIEDVE